MDWLTYINSLKEITMEDIPSIIREDLDKQDEFSFYGFKVQRNAVFFGKYEEGFITRPYLFTCDQDDNACEKFYDMLQSEFPNVFEYGYRHYFSGEYDYYGDADNLRIEFPKLSKKDEDWIFNQVHNNRKCEGKMHKLTNNQ